MPRTRTAPGPHLVLHLSDDLDDRHVAADARAAGVIVRPLSRHRATPGTSGLIINDAAHHPA